MNNSELNGSLMVDLQSFKGKSIISLNEGQRVGSVEEVIIHPDTFEVAGVITSKGGLFNSTESAIPASEVRLWGKDVIFVTQSEVVQNKSDLPDIGDTVNAGDYLPGRGVINANGDRLGDLKDVLIDVHGNIAGIQLSKGGQSFVDRLTQPQEQPDYPWLPISVIRSIGKDVVIVDVPTATSVTPDESPAEDNAQPQP